MENEKYDGEYADFIFNKREMEMPARESDARVIRLHNYQWGPMHISCRGARAFTLRCEWNEWTYTAQTMIAALIITPPQDRTAPM